MHIGKLLFTQQMDHLATAHLSVLVLFHTILQILSLTSFEKTSLNQLVISIKSNKENARMTNQLNLFTEISGQ